MRPANTKSLYRYSQTKWLKKSLYLGEFLLLSASYIKSIENDVERQDDERNRNYEIDSTYLSVTHTESGEKIPLSSNLSVSSSLRSDYYMLCFTTQHHDMMFDIFNGADSCLVIHDRKEFASRLYDATEQVLPGWGAADAGVIYGDLRHELGAPFMKSEKYLFQFEWRYVWLPIEPVSNLENLNVSIGSIEDIAHVELQA